MIRFLLFILFTLPYRIFVLSFGWTLAYWGYLSQVEGSWNIVVLGVAIGLCSFECVGYDKFEGFYWRGI